MDVQFLRNIPLFSALQDAELEQVAGVIRKKDYRKNDVIFHQDEPGNALFIVTSGLVKISLMDKNGREAILKMVYANDFFGEMSLLDGYFRSATVTAVEACQAILLARDDFISLIKEHPELILSMLLTLSRRIRKTDEKIASLSFFDAPGKVAGSLLDITRNHTPDAATGLVTLAVSRQNMADIAGISRETLTRVLHDFQSKSYIRLHKRKITILDHHALERELL